MERVMDVDNVKEVVNDNPMELINEVDLDIYEIFDIQMQMINHTCQELEMRQYISVIILLCNVVHALHLLEVLSTCLHSRVSDSTQRDRWRRELMRSLVHGRWCRDVIRMGSQAFFCLCQKLRGTGIVKDTIRSTVEEQVAKFLQIVGQNAKNSAISFLYHRSGETVSRHFHNVMHAIISLEGEFLVQPMGFMLKCTLLTLYRGVRYHLKEYSARGPQNSKELFNHRHSSLINVIERTFSVLKKRFLIISSGSEPHYSFEIMRDIVLACCILHNFLRGVDDDRSLIAEVDHELCQQDIDGFQTQQRDEDYREGELLRENIANEMWNAYQV
ncbi:hypothetical protein Lal_00016815 [Lupinus albus]|nr:hypothetical protein Lal_00016815 [Lupinus albus]